MQKRQNDIYDLMLLLGSETEIGSDNASDPVYATSLEDDAAPITTREDLYDLLQQQSISDAVSQGTAYIEEANKTNPGKDEPTQWESDRNALFSALPSEQFQIMEQNAFIPSLRDIPSSRGIKGALGRLVKKTVRRCTRFFIEPASLQQSRYNDAVLNEVKRINGGMNVLDGDIMDINNTIQAIKDVLGGLNAGVEENKRLIAAHGKALKKEEALLEDHEDEFMNLQGTMSNYGKVFDELIEAQQCHCETEETLKREQECQRESQDAIKQVLDEHNGTFLAIKQEQQRQRETGEALKQEQERQRESQYAVKKVLDEYNGTFSAIKQEQQRQRESQDAIKKVLDEHNDNFSAIKSVQAEQNASLLEVIENQRGLMMLRDQLRIAFDGISRMEQIAKKFEMINTQTNDYSLQSFSQSGEDGIMNYIFRALGIPKNSLRYLDLGANHAKEISNTYALYLEGASGVLVEANPSLIPELSLYRSNDIIINKCLIADPEKKTVPFYVMNGDGLSSFDKESVDDAIRQNSLLRIERVEQVPTITLEEIIHNFFPIAPDVLNIDLEGMEEQVLGAIDFEQWRPLIIIIETIPYHPYLVHDEKRNELVDYLKERDYTEYAFTGINSIMVDRKRLRKNDKE